jgi:hypothetical protein
MKKYYTGSPRLAALTAVIGSGLSTIALAGTTEPAPMMAPVEEDGIISGSLSFDYNTHFISYGFDVWASGQNFGGSSTFNPSLQLDWALTDSTTFFIGTWWDVNDNVTSAIGGDLQEVDVWAGISQSFGALTVSATYQAWMYGSDTETILDIGLSYDCLLSPSLTIHNRLDEGASGGQDGTVLVLGISHDFEVGPVTISPSAGVGYFLEDDYHPASTDDGFGYTSFGLSASLPLTFIDSKFGEWDLHGGLTYYITDDQVVANAKDDDFLTGSIGIGVAF